MEREERGRGGREQQQQQQQEQWRERTDKTLDCGGDDCSCATVHPRLSRVGMSVWKRPGNAKTKETHRLSRLGLELEMGVIH